MKQTKVYLLTTILTLFSCILTSCNSNEENNNNDLQSPPKETLLPGKTVSGAVGCTESQISIMESLPGMGNIVNTTLDDNGNLIYCDVTGNKCTLDKEGNMSVVCTNGNTVYRDKTIHEEETRSASLFYGTIMIGRHYDDNEIDICPENNTLSYLLHEFPEAPIKQTIDSPTTVYETEKYDSISITFFNTSCYTSKTLINNRKAYDNVYTKYTATDGYFYHKDTKFHLVVKDNMAYVNIVNENGEEMQASQRVQSTSTALTKTNYNHSKSTFEKSPTASIFYNYTVNQAGDIVLTNATNQMVLVKDGREYETHDSYHLKLKVQGNAKEEDKEESIIAPPSPEIKEF